MRQRILVLFTLLALGITALAQTLPDDRVIGNWRGGGNGRDLELQLSSRGSAVAKVGRESLTGTWRLDSANRVIVDTGRNGRGFAFVFRYVDNSLVATSWDKDYFGYRELRLRRSGDSGGGYDPYPDRGIDGTYYWLRDGRSQELVTLDFESRGRVTLTYDRPNARTYQSRGDWNAMRDGKIEVELRGSRGTDRFVLRRSGTNRLIATSWDRNDWGRDTPEFSKGRKPDIQPIDLAEGIWTWRRSGNERYTLSLMPRGRVDWQQELGRGRESADGTWSWDGDEIRVRINRRRDTLNFRFRVDRDRLSAISWDRDEFGSSRPEFRRG